MKKIVYLASGLALFLNIEIFDFVVLSTQIWILIRMNKTYIYKINNLGLRLALKVKRSDNSRSLKSCLVKSIYLGIMQS